MSHHRGPAPRAVLAEEQILSAVKLSAQLDVRADRDNLRLMAKQLFQAYVVTEAEWHAALGRLLAEMLLVEDGALLHVNSATRERMERRAREDLRQAFDKSLADSEGSPAYGRYCEAVFGQDLKQFNLTDMAELDELISLSAISETTRVLDLGCGSGLVAEYISDRTGATVLGIDIARGAIERARARTALKRGRLGFETGDIDALALPARSFNVIVALETLSFAVNLEATVASLAEILSPRGRMILSWQQEATCEQECAFLGPRHTPLAAALDACGLRFQVFDRTEAGLQFLCRACRVLEELRGDFEAEGHRDLHRWRSGDVRRLLDLAQKGGYSRHLLLVGGGCPG